MRRIRGDNTLGRFDRALARFLKAEEVPRWFGFSLVLIYLVGLGTVANLGIRQARLEAAGQLEQTARAGLGLLVRHLESDYAGRTEDAAQRTALQRTLSAFAAEVPMRSLRVVQGRTIVASNRSDEVGTAAAADAGTLPAIDQAAARILVSGQELPDYFFRFPLTLAGADGARRGAAVLEAQLPAHTTRVTTFADHAESLCIVLVILGALFVMYRCLREQLRGVSRIADRLQIHRERLEDDLSSLRIADTLDNVTAAWNELVDLTQRLLENVQRAEANEELSRALRSSTGGALAEALNAVPDGIVYIAGEGRFEYLNSAACQLFGWSPDQAKRAALGEAESRGTGGKVLSVLRDSCDREGAFLPRVEVIESEEEQNPVRSSYRIWIIPLPQPQHEHSAIVMIRDVSQQLRAERAREEFVAQVTHELRTPLTNIRAYAETLSSGMFDDPKVVTECYNVITKETRRLSRLIEDILSVSQLEVGTIDLAVDQIDLKTLLNEAVRDVRGLADEKRIDLQLVLPAKLEPIRGDRDKLAVVVNNLLGNAIKYTPADGNVLVGCQQTGDTVVLTVKDNGYGIEPADHARVFEKFQRGHDPDVQQEAGTGIGLYTAREIVRRHGGDISLISTKGEGSTFLVRLPHRGSRATSMTHESEEPAGGDRGRRMAAS